MFNASVTVLTIQATAVSIVAKVDKLFNYTSISENYVSWNTLVPAFHGFISC
jgi:hypothetical protein